MSDVAQLLVPALRWDPERGFEGERAGIEAALKLGVGGFLLEGGTVDAVRALTKELRERVRSPLLIGADLERGAGQQFEGATGLPPLAAVADLGDRDAVRRAARLTAREARTMGVNWDLAPVCDLDLDPESPVVGTRSLGRDPKQVATLVGEWIDACQSEGVLACAKHFPGIGRTRGDGHLELPVVNAGRGELHDADMAPFRAAIDAGVGSMMTAPAAYPALDPSGLPATLSREILQWMLRQQLRFDGLVVTPALAMAGVRAGQDEGDVAVQALRAGCDLLLHPTDVAGVARALEQAVQTGALDRERVHQATRRRMKWAQWVSPPNDWRRPSLTDVAWGTQLCDRVVRVVRGTPRPLVGRVEVVVVDDDVDGSGVAGAAPPSREPFAGALRAAGREVRVVEAPGDARGPLVVALFGDPRAAKGRVGYGDAARQAVARAVDAARQAARDVTVVQFSHPRLAESIPQAETVLCAWGGERAMQEAAARWLVKAR